VAWCDEHQELALPASTEAVARYAAFRAENSKPATIKRCLAGIAYVHKLKGYGSPTNDETVKGVLAGIRRELGTRQERKQPITAALLKRMLAQAPAGLAGLRDRALLLVGFAGALRRSELVALTVQDLERTPEGVLVHLRRSKTDQEGAGRLIAIPRGGKLRTLETLEEWLNTAGLTVGPIFRSVSRHGRLSATGLSEESVGRLVQRYAGKAGVDPSLFGAHSLRAGFVTSALEAGADAMRVMDVTGHKDPRTLKVYDRRAPFAGHAGRSFL
jgi:integrase